MYKILKNTIEMDDYSVQKLSNLQPPEPFEWNTVEGTELNVSDCIGGKGKIEVKGNTEQEQLSGNQLYDVLDVYNASSEITVDEEGWITATYDNTAGSSAKYLLYYTNKSDLLETNKSYAIFTEIKSVNGTGMLYAISIYDNQSQSSAPLAYNFNGLSNNSIKKSIFNTSSDFNTANTMLRTLIQIRPGESGSITFRLSVLENTDTTIEQFLYEKYCGGQASPNPEYPQEIKVVTGDNVVKHVGKNLFNFQEKIDTSSGLESTINKTNLKITGTATSTQKMITRYIENTFKKGNYVFSIDKAIPNKLILRFFDENNNVLNSYSVDNTTTTVAFSLSGSEKNYRLIFNPSIDTTYNIDINLQLEEGTTATPYEQYREEEYELNLGNIELCKIGDYSDILFKNEVGNTNYNSSLVEGAWYKKNVVGKVVLTGAEDYTSSTSGGLLRYKTLINNSISEGNYRAEVLSSHFRYGSSGNEVGYIFNAINSLFMYPEQTITTIESFKSWLAENNVTVYYIIKNPTYTQITDTTLISQLEALRKAKWFKGVNHWWTETNNLELVLKGTYRQAINE